jgi:hypothetical protein
VWFFLWSCAENDCSLLSSAEKLLEYATTKPISGYVHLWNFPSIINSSSMFLWFGWLLLQFLLYSYMPGPRDVGQPTPAGYTLKYVVNGWNCWWLCHIAAIAVFYYLTGFQAALVVSKNWIPLFWVS